MPVIAPPFCGWFLLAGAFCCSSTDLPKKPSHRFTVVLALRCRVWAWGHIHKLPRYLLLHAGRYDEADPVVKALNNLEVSSGERLALSSTHHFSPKSPIILKYVFAKDWFFPASNNPPPPTPHPQTILKSVLVKDWFFSVFNISLPPPPPPTPKKKKRKKEKKKPKPS